MSDDAITLDQVLALKHGGTGEVVNVDEEVTKLVVFTLGPDWFAFHGDNVREILNDCPIFFLPGCPASLEGVINVRGDIESVVRLRSVLGYGDATKALGSKLLLGQAAGMRSAIRVDTVQEVLDVPQSGFQSPPHTITDHLRGLVVGIVHFSDHIISVLDMNNLFEDYRAGLR